METTTDPKSFAFRLRHTITQLEQETAAGIENWAPTIDRLKATLAEVEKEESDNPVAANLDRFDGILSVLGHSEEEVAD